MMDESTKSRLRLWLRSERAMGLPSVGPLHENEMSAAEVLVENVPEAAPVEQRVEIPTTMRPTPPRSTESKNIRPPEMQILPQDPAPSAGSFAGPVLALDERRKQLTVIDESEVRGCTKCALCETRGKTVFGEGAADARLMFIGEGPGSREDQTGRPFVGPAGELLNRMIGAMGLQREQVYIANVVKCRAFMPGPPPKDRAPALEEVTACSPYLERQVEIIRPQVIVTLGVPATQHVLQTKLSMSRLRGTWSAWHGIKVMPTWHPSYLLRREKDGDVEPKRQAWSDLQKVMAELGLVVRKKGE